MKTINIHGKNYVPVNERLKEFHKLFENGMVETKIIESDMTSGTIIMQAIIYPDAAKKERFFTGHAFEFRGDTKSMVNAASWVENCETSSIGRALGALGIGIDDGFASANEVENKTGRAYTPVKASKPADSEYSQEIPVSNLCDKCGSEMIAGKSGKLYCKPCYIAWADREKRRKPTAQ
jgi:hypothetical protein